MVMKLDEKHYNSVQKDYFCHINRQPETSNRDILIEMYFLERKKNLFTEDLKSFLLVYICVISCLNGTLAVKTISQMWHFQE